MKNKALLAVFLLFFAIIQQAGAQSAGDYKSNGTGGGVWNDASTWLQYNGTAYLPAASAPANTTNAVLIQANDLVSITSNETISQLTVAPDAFVTLTSGKTMTLGAGITVNGTLTISGILVCSTYIVAGTGTFTLSSGATLNIGSAGGITTIASTGNIQTTIRTFSAAANYIYTSTAAQVTGNGLPSGITGTITNNNTNATSGLTLSQSFAVTAPGSFNVPTASVLTCASNTNITGTGNFTLSSGAKIYIGNASGISTAANTGNIQVTGARNLSASANYTYYGTNTQSIGTGFPSPFTGVLTIANTNASGCSLNANLVVNSPGSIVVPGALACPANFIISGTGSFGISSGGTLLTAHASGISSTSATGSIQNTGGITFPIDGNYIYYGSVAQVTGPGLPATVGSLYINNTSTTAAVSLTNAVTVNGNLTLNAGTLCLNNNTLTVAANKTVIRKGGVITLCGGSLVYGGTINLSYTNTASITTGPEMQSAGGTVSTLTINQTAGTAVTLSSSITVGTSLTITSGALALGGYTLLYSVGSSLTYNGAAAQTVGEEWPNAAFNVPVSIKNTNMASGVVLNANKTAYSNTITVSSGGYLNTGAYTITGSGGITVSAGGTYITPHVLGVSPSAAIQLTGTRSFAAGSNYTFNGSSAQVTGMEMPSSVGNLTINNTAATPTVTLSNTSGTQTITGVLALTAGTFDVSANATILTFRTGNTPVTRVAGSLTTGSSTSLQFGITGNLGGNAFTLPNNMFTTAPVINNLSINRTNSITLGNQNITLNGTLTLTAGVLDLASTTLIFQTSHTPVAVTAGTITAGATASLQFGTAGNTGGNAFALPNTLFTTAPTFSNLTINRTNALTLGTQNITLTNTLNLVNGQLNIGASTLGINGTINITGGILNGGSTAGLAVGGTGGNLVLPAIANNLGSLSIARPNVGSVAAVTLRSNLTLTTNLNLSGGSIALSAANLTLGNAATITNMNASRFVITNNSANSGGYLIRQAAASAVLFPVGTTTYTPALINNAAGTADNYRVRVFDGILSSGTSGATYANSNHTVNKTWLVEETVTGGSNVTLTLQWNSADENLAFDRNSTFVSHYAAPAWDVTIGSASTVVADGVYSQTRAGLTSFSPYSVHERQTVLPVNWLHFSASRKADQIVLHWRVGDAKNNLQFDIERSLNGTVFKPIGLVPVRADFATTGDYSFTDLAPQFYTTTYYRIRQIDTDGQVSYSKTIAVKGNANDGEMQLYPVPIKEVITITVPAQSKQAATVLMWDAAGKEVIKQPWVLEAGSNSIQIPVAHLSSGYYTVQVIAGENRYSKTIIK